MALTNLTNPCTPLTLPYPTVFGAQFTSIQANLVQNYSAFTQADIAAGLTLEDLLSGNTANFGTKVSFCNVTLTHTHPGQNDVITSNIWMPVQPAWNQRLQAVGGGGWVAGLSPLTGPLSMAEPIVNGYATVLTDGGVSDGSLEPSGWALLSPGNVNLLGLQNFASVAIKDGVLAAKSLINSFYGMPAKYSYWSGCSQGGRQGFMFAQRYPDIFDGIQANAPAIYWSNLFYAAYYPHQVMNELGEFPSACELDALTNAAVAACGVDGVIQDQDACEFDPYELLGSPIDCTGVSTISEAAATVAYAAWNGVKDENGAWLWDTVGISANISTDVAKTSCSANGTCVDAAGDFFPPWIRLFVEKNPVLDLSTFSRENFVASFKKGAREYEGIMQTGWTDLSEFKNKGGKLLTFHGLSDPLVPYKTSRYYFDAVSKIVPDVNDFYRLFEAPGVNHCSGGLGAAPVDQFEVLVKWVEEGVAPQVLEAFSPVTNKTGRLCLYPEKEC